VFSMNNKIENVLGKVRISFKYIQPSRPAKHN
jgi:hypothetical protein